MKTVHSTAKIICSVPVRENFWHLSLQKFSFKGLESAVESCAHTIGKSYESSFDENSHPIFLSCTSPQEITLCFPVWTVLKRIMKYKKGDLKIIK